MGAEGCTQRMLIVKVETKHIASTALKATLCDGVAPSNRQRSVAPRLDGGGEGGSTRSPVDAFARKWPDSARHHNDTGARSMTSARYIAKVQGIDTLFFGKEFERVMTPKSL